MVQIIPDNSWELNREMISLGMDRMHVNDIWRLYRLRLYGSTGEIKRYSKDVRILGIVKSSVSIRFVAQTTQGAANYLLAKELSTERAHAKDVRDGVGIPSLGQHRHG